MFFIFYVNDSVFLSLDTQKSKALTRKDSAEDFLEMYCRSHPTSDDRSPRKTVVELKREITDLKEENAKLKEMVVQGIGPYHSLNHLSTNTFFSKSLHIEFTVLWGTLLCIEE